MKLNWGFGIFVFYTGFVVFILFLVFRSSQERVDLVTEDYYQQELEFQEIIDQKKNANNLEPGLIYQIDHMDIKFQFPPSQNQIDGRIQVYRPSNKNFDKWFDIELSDDNSMKISMEDSPLGLYKMMVKWESDSMIYYVEEDVYLKP